MSTRTLKSTVVFDFDGVIHNYKNGWKGPDIIDDEPVIGIREALADIKQPLDAHIMVAKKLYSNG